MAREVQGVKWIRHNIGRINNPDDTTFPFKLEVNLRSPEFPIVTFPFMQRSINAGIEEEIVVRGTTVQTLERFIAVNGLERHPRMLRLTITGPNGVVREVKK